MFLDLLNSSKCDLVEELGIPTFNLSSAADPVAWCLDNTCGIGVDGVIITALLPHVTHRIGSVMSTT